ncbi:MAG: DUF3015 family protein [Oligoflexus sp.]|nr:DUF3015 family protein [Oligoflexus sp.]
MRCKIILLLTAMIFSSGAFAKSAKGKKKKKHPPAKVEALKESEAIEEDSPADAVSTARTPSYQTAYGMAGCGLGSLIIQDNSAFLQFSASITNSTYLHQTFSITSGVSGCAGSKSNLAVEQKVFIESNLVSLNREAVTGQGETLRAFADLLGCETETFSKVSKDNFRVIYGDREPASILAGYKTFLPDQCSRLI